MSRAGHEGPDQIIQSDALYTHRLDGYVKLRESFEVNVTPMSVPTMLKQAAQKFHNNPAFAFKDLDGWKFISFNEFLNRVRTVAKAFLKLGLQRHHAVCILGSNAPEWLISSMAAIFAGGVSSGIYQTISAEACLHCLKTSMANIVIVEDDRQLQKILEIRNHAPSLKVIIQYSGSPTNPAVLSWNDVLDIGNKESDSHLEEVMRTLAINECCTLLFTSGTTSPSKAVMLSHDNVIYSMFVAAKHMKVDTRNVLFSYLPLSHTLAQEVDMYLPLLYGGCCYFAEKDALKSQQVLIENLKEVRPTYFVGVPRVWEKIIEYLIAREKKESEYLLYDVESTSLTCNEHISNGEVNGANLKWRAQVGLDRCSAPMTGAAPLSIQDKECLYSRFGICIREGYGLTECAGPHVVGTPEDINSKAISKAASGLPVKIDKPDEYGVGELCLNGRNIFMGYLHELEKTREVIDEDGWLHTGDLAKLDDNSRIQICGRIKELLITSGGENVTPLIIEKAIQCELPVVNNVIVIGDGKKYLSALITLKSQINPVNGIPLDELSQDAKDWCKSLNCNYETVSQIVREKPPAVYQAIQQGIERANEKATSHVQKIKKFTILPRDFSIATGELGPTTKLMRHAVHKKYKSEIEQMYV